MRNLELECAVVEWLRYERGCRIVVLERGLGSNYRPDVMGVNRNRMVVEVECKRSLSDFKADAAKRITSWRQSGALNVSQFYYMVPPALVEPVRALLPSYAGLLTLSKEHSPFTKLNKCRCAAAAPVNRSARRLSPFEMGRMVMHSTATVQRLMSYIVKLQK